MKTPRLAALGLVVVVASCARAPSPTPSTATPALDAGTSNAGGDPYRLDGIVARVQRVVAPQVGQDKNVGAVVGIRFHGETRILSFGETKRGNGTAPDARTMFEIGSITKTFTGLLLADAIERGTIREDARIDAFRPEWRGQAASDIRLIDLVTHRSGLPRLPCNLHPADPTQPYAAYGDADLIGSLADRSFGKGCSLGTHPSERMAYSNWNLALLGWILARASKTTYEALVRARITEPLGLTDTSIELSEDQRRRFAQGYTQEGDETPRWERKAMMGNGALRSSMNDLLAYGEAWLHPEKHAALEAAMRRAMALQHEGSEGRIAYAWMLTPTGSLWHDGATGGFSSLVKVYRTRDLVVGVLTNSSREIRCVIAAVEDGKC